MILAGIFGEKTGTNEPNREEIRIRIETVYRKRQRTVAKKIDALTELAIQLIKEKK